LQSLGPLGDGAVPLFFTLDPARDTPALLDGYTRAFDPRIVALTGTVDAIAAVARDYRVFSKVVKVDGALGYTIDHSAFIYVVGRDGKYLGSCRRGRRPRGSRRW
jgi:protein SCO1/2